MREFERKINNLKSLGQLSLYSASFTARARAAQCVRRRQSGVTNARFTHIHTARHHQRLPFLLESFWKRASPLWRRRDAPSGGEMLVSGRSDTHTHTANGSVWSSTRTTTALHIHHATPKRQIRASPVIEAMVSENKDDSQQPTSQERESISKNTDCMYCT